MNFAGFIMPDWNNAYDWFYNIYKGHANKPNFYLINAENAEEAKLKYFNYLYDNNYINISYTTWESIRYLLQEMSEKDIKAKFNVEDIEIILKISKNFLSLTEIEQSKYDPYTQGDFKLIEVLSEKTKKAMSFKSCDMIIAIVPFKQII